MPTCLRLFWHVVRLALSRTCCTAGTSRPIRMAMMAITTSSSISVKPCLRMRSLLETDNEKEYETRSTCTCWEEENKRKIDEGQGKQGGLRRGIAPVCKQSLE